MGPCYAVLLALIVGLASAQPPPGVARLPVGPNDITLPTPDTNAASIALGNMAKAKAVAFIGKDLAPGELTSATTYLGNLPLTTFNLLNTQQQIVDLVYTYQVTQKTGPPIGTLTVEFDADPAGVQSGNKENLWQPAHYGYTVGWNGAKGKGDVTGHIYFPDTYSLKYARPPLYDGAAQTAMENTKKVFKTFNPVTLSTTKNGKNARYMSVTTSQETVPAAPAAGRRALKSASAGISGWLAGRAA